MWPSVFDYAKDFCAVFLSGIIIKITDDFIDASDTASTSIWLKRLGKGVLPYCILAFSLALLLNFHLSLSLYLGAYVVGMFKEPESLFPTGLKGYQEILAVLVAGSMIIGYRVLFHALILLLMVQLIDDLIDFPVDKAAKNNNIFSVIGIVEGKILLAIAALANFALQPFLAASTLLAMFIISKVSVLGLCKGENGI